MELKNIILHQISRINNEDPILNLSKRVLDKDNETVIGFVKRLIKSFSLKNPTYGVFKDDEDQYPFQLKVNCYLKKEDFLSFSRESMNILKKEINVPKAVGGYVVFAHYLEKDMDFLVTIMLDKSAQFTIDDESLNIKQLKTLDIDKLARANRLNITKWKNDADLYLAFIKGTRDVSSYFQKFIGNTDLTSSKTNANNLQKALNIFMRMNKYSEDKKESINRDIQKYVEEMYSKKEDVKITSISAFVNTEDITSFLTYVQDNEELEVSGSFRVGKKSDFNFLHKSTVVGQGYKFEFEKNLINKIIFRENNNIVIKNVSADVLDNEFGLLLDDRTENNKVLELSFKC